MFNRVEEVLRFRKSILGMLRIAAHDDILLGRPWSWRFEVYDSGASFQRMLFSFKALKVENFYKDTKFLEPTHEAERSEGVG